MRLLGALSAFIFMVGCLAILVVILCAWAYLLVLTASWSVLAGWGVFALSAIAWVWYQSVLQAPWVAWFQVWRWGDDALFRRMGP